MPIPTEFFRWHIPDQYTGELRLSRWHMTEEDAQKRYPGCKPSLGSREVRQIASNEEEHKAFMYAEYDKRQPINK